MHDETTLEIYANRLCPELKNLKLLDRALAHRSYIKENPSAQSNERLEFLGDSVIGLIIAEYLHNIYPDRKEGNLAKAKSWVVSEPVLAAAARSLGIAEMVLMSSGEENTGGRDRPSILSDVFEAVTAVIYLDCGLQTAREFVLKSTKVALESVEAGDFQTDFKGTLQEMTQASHKIVPDYTVVEEVGEDHDKEFTVEVLLEKKVLGVGKGKRKKEAEQAAAKAAIQNLDGRVSSNENNCTS